MPQDRSGWVRKTSSPLRFDLRTAHPVTSENSVQQLFIAQEPYESLHTLRGAQYYFKNERLIFKFSPAQHRFPIRFVSFFVSSVCLLVRVNMVDKNKAVVCCLLATPAIMLSEKRKIKRKMWSKKWYLKRNISCDAHLLNELLETDVP